MAHRHLLSVLTFFAINIANNLNMHIVVRNEERVEAIYKRFIDYKFELSQCSSYVIFLYNVYKSITQSPISDYFMYQ